MLQFISSKWFLKGAGSACIIIGGAILDSVIFRKQNQRIWELEKEGDRLMDELQKKVNDDLVKDTMRIIEEKEAEIRASHDQFMKDLEIQAEKNREEIRQRSIKEREELRKKLEQIKARSDQDMQILEAIMKQRS